MNSMNLIVARNIKRLREEKKLSMDELAKLSGVSKSMLGQIERGESNPTISTIGKIVEGLRIPFEQTGKFELLSVRLEAETECQNPPHHEETVEYVTVIQGRLLLSVGEEDYVVEEQQAVRFHTTQNYFYKNHGKTPLLLQVVISHEQISAY